jgi:hypothetical protein
VAQPRRFKPRPPNATLIQARAAEGLQIMLTLDILPASRHRDPRHDLLRKSNDWRKDAPISVPSKEGRGEFGPG